MSVARRAGRTEAAVATKSGPELAAMRRAGKVVAAVLARLSAAVAPGVRTEQLDELAAVTAAEMGAVPSFKGYGGFPAHVCVSVNDEVVHGIPGPRVLVAGDLVSLDFGAIWQGWQADGAVTVPVGKITPSARRLLQVTREALYLGIDQAREGRRLCDIAAAVQGHVERNGFSVVRELVGHGIGRQMHEPPQVPNYVEAASRLVLRAGMTLAIEPMVNAGSEQVQQDANGWTFRTRDGSLSAHFEHTVAVTAARATILTAP